MILFHEDDVPRTKIAIIYPFTVIMATVVHAVVLQDMNIAVASGPADPCTIIHAYLVHM